MPSKSLTTKNKNNDFLPSTIAKLLPNFANPRLPEISKDPNTQYPESDRNAFLSNCIRNILLPLL